MIKPAKLTDRDTLSYNSGMIQGIGFDLGNTLSTSGFPLSWQKYYHVPLVEILVSFGIEATDEKIRTGEAVFLKYNTRINYREYEVDSDTIFTELLTAWSIDDLSLVKPAKDVFTDYFLMRSELFPETQSVLETLRHRGMKTGVLTNLAYGLGGDYLMRDVTQVSRYTDVFLTSFDVGFRKPHPAGFLELAEKLGIVPEACLFVGDETADIDGANACGMTSVLIDRKESGKNYGQKHTVTTLNDILKLV